MNNGILEGFKIGLEQRELWQRDLCAWVAQNREMGLDALLKSLPKRFERINPEAVRRLVGFVLVRGIPESFNFQALERELGDFWFGVWLLGPRHRGGEVPNE